MINFDTIAEEIQNASEEFSIAEWKGCFEHTLNCMGQEAVQQVKKGNCSFNLKSIDLHLLNYTDRDYPDGFDECLGMFAFTSETLPTLSDAAAKKLETSIQEDLNAAGWNHLRVSIERINHDVHMIAYTTV